MSTSPKNPLSSSPVPKERINVGRLESFEHQVHGTDTKHRCARFRVALVVFTVTTRQGVNADQISISVRKTIRTAHDASSMQSIVKEMMAASATHQEVDMQYIDPRHAAFLWDAMYELRPNQEVRCILPGRPNERWRIRYTGIGRGCPLIEINNFNEEDQTFACFCFFLESRRHALLLSSGYKPDRNEMCRAELVTLSASGLPTIRDLDRHYAWTQLVNVIFDGANGFA